MSARRTVYAVITSGVAAACVLAGAAAQPVTAQSRTGIRVPNVLRTTERLGGAIAVDPGNAELGFRSSMGLPADPSYVRALHQEYIARVPGVLYAYGGIFTAAEYKTLAFRQHLTEFVSPQPAYAPGIAHATRTDAFYRYILANSGSYGGLYIDQKAGGIVTVLFTSDVNRNRRDLEKIFPFSGHLRVLKAAHTYASLLATTHQIAADVDTLRAQGVKLSTWGPDVQANMVRVGLSTLSPSSEALLRRLYPAVPLEFTTAPVAKITGTQDELSPPMKGGLGIWETESDAGCTASFPLVGPAWPGGAGNTYWSTAGHCGPPDDLWNQGPQPPNIQAGHTIGNAFYDTFGSEWSNGSQTENDAAAIADNTTDMTKDIVLSDYSCGFLCTGVNERVLHGMEQIPQPGESTCMSGAYSGGEHCSTIISIDNCITYSGLQKEGFPNDTAQICNVAFANLNSTFGDSGSPVYQPETTGTSMAQGILSGCFTNPDGSCAAESIFTQIAEALTNLGGGGWSIDA
jgi:hypothetical protein